MEKEIWVKCCLRPDYYMVSSLGRIKTIDHHVETTLNNGKPGASFRKHKYFVRGSEIAQGSIPSGYKTAHICSSRPYYVHRLVWFSFNGGDFFDANAVVMHLNDVKNDNRLVNLKIGTHKENIQAAYITGRIKPIYTEDEIRRIYEMRWTMKQADCAKIFGCSQRYVSIIWRGEGGRLKRFYDSFIRGEEAEISD